MDISDFASVLYAEPPVAHVTVVGELDAFTSPQLSRCVGDAIAAGCTDVRMYLGGLTFIDAAGIGLLVRLRVMTAQLGGRLELVETSDCVRRLCTILQLGPAFGLDEPSTGSPRRGIA